MSLQLPLGIGLRDSATFANFFEGANGAALHQLRSGAEPFVLIWGAEGTGRSHLLQAACHAAGQGAAFLPLAEEAFTPAIVEGLEAMSLIAIDDLQAVAGDTQWELALFHLYNRARDRSCRILASADAPPLNLKVALPDLRSRFAWGPVYHLAALDDDGKAAALQLRARRRGMELPDEVAAYLIRRSPRDMASLFALLDGLDRASLAAQRRLTIPFLRQYLSDG